MSQFQMVTLMAPPVRPHPIALFVVAVVAVLMVFCKLLFDFRTFAIAVSVVVFALQQQIAAKWAVPSLE